MFGSTPDCSFGNRSKRDARKRRGTAMAVHRPRSPRLDCCGLQYTWHRYVPMAPKSGCLSMGCWRLPDHRSRLRVALPASETRMCVSKRFHQSCSSETVVKPVLHLQGGATSLPSKDVVFGKSSKYCSLGCCEMQRGGVQQLESWHLSE